MSCCCCISTPLNCPCSGHRYPVCWATERGAPLCCLPLAPCSSCTPLPACPPPRACPLLEHHPMSPPPPHCPSLPFCLTPHLSHLSLLPCTPSSPSPLSPQTLDTTHHRARLWVPFAPPEMLTKPPPLPFHAPPKPPNLGHEHTTGRAALGSWSSATHVTQRRRCTTWTRPTSWGGRSRL